MFGSGWVINRAHLDWAEEERGCILLRGGAVFLKMDGSNLRRLPGGCGLMRAKWKEVHSVTMADINLGPGTRASTMELSVKVPVEIQGM